MRTRVYQAMERAEVARSRMHRYATCGDDVHVYYDPSSGEVQPRGSKCEDRMCLTCGQARSRDIAGNIRELIADRAPLFVTLTIRGKCGDHLAAMLTRLRAAWRELRRQPLWKDSVRGGAVMLEVKWSKHSGGHWHPHYHILADGRWIDVQRLRAAWYAITGDSDQVDVQRVKEVETAMGYVTKYASKPLDASFALNVARCAEAIHALRGQRLCACFGSWHGTPLRSKLENWNEADTLTQWVYCGTVDSLRSRVQTGDAEAVIILAAVERAMRLRHTLDIRCRGPSEMREPTHGLDIEPHD